MATEGILSTNIIGLTVKQKHQNFRQSSRPETGILSPARSGFAHTFSLALLQDRVLRPQPRLYAHPHSRGRGSPPNERGSCGDGETPTLFLGDSEVLLFPVWNICLFRVGICFLRRRELVSIFSSVSRSRGVDRFLPITYLGG